MPFWTGLLSGCRRGGAWTKATLMADENRAGAFGGLQAGLALACPARGGLQHGRYGACCNHKGGAFHDLSGGI